MGHQTSKGFSPRRATPGSPQSSSIAIASQRLSLPCPTSPLVPGYCWETQWPVSFVDFAQSGLLCRHAVWAMSASCRLWRTLCATPLPGCPEATDDRSLYCVYPSPVHCAAVKGGAGLLRLLHERLRWPLRQPAALAAEAAYSGSVETLRYLQEKGCSPDDTATREAAQSGSLECLTYVHETCGCKWDATAATAAVFSGHLELLEYAHDHGCPLTPLAAAAAAAMGRLDVLSYLMKVGQWDDRTPAEAAANGNVECLTFAHEHGCPWNVWTCRRAARSGNLPLLKYARENGCPWDEATMCSDAVIGQSVDVLRFCHESGCRLDPKLTSQCAEVGSLACFVYAHECGCQWDQSTCECAARFGHLSCLQYCHENGCRWNSNTCTAAAANGHIDCLTYANENGCPLISTALEAAVRGGHKRCQEYCRSHLPT